VKTLLNITKVDVVSGRDHSEDLDVDGSVILKWILGKWGGKEWTGFISLRVGTSSGLL
jgi:hypothetical protein